MLADFQDAIESIFLNFAAVVGGPEFATILHLVDNLSSALPEQQIDSTSWTRLQVIPLANPKFALPAGVDLIFGADICDELFSGNKITGSAGTPPAFESVFGYVMMGLTNEHQRQSRICLVVASQTTTFLQRLGSSGRWRKFRHPNH